MFIVRTIPYDTFTDLSYTITICFNCYYSLHLFRLHNNNCSIDLWNENLQTTIILFARNVSSHKTDWILSASPLLDLSCLLYRRVSSLINALKREYLCPCEISINVNKLFTVIFVLRLRCPYSAVVACLFLNPFFILMLLLYFCLLVKHVNKSIIIIFEAFVCHFNNTISISFNLLCWFRFNIQIAFRLDRSYCGPLWCLR